MSVHKNTYLKKINRTYYVRARLPKHTNFDKLEICFSLGTQDLGRASLAVSIFKTLLSRPLLCQTNWLKEATLKLFRAVERQLETSLSEELIPSLISAAYPNDLLSTAMDRTEVSLDELKVIVDEQCPRFLNENNVKFDSNSKAIQLLKQKVMGIEFAINKFAGARLIGDIETQMKYQESIATFEAQKATALPIAFKQVQLPKLTEMLDTFIEEWRNPDDGKPCSKDRENKFISTFNELLFFIGNKPVNLYTEQEIQLLFDYFAKTPKARNKNHKRNSIKELLALNANGDQIQSYENRVKHRQRLRQFFDWVIEQIENSGDPLAKSLELINPAQNTKIRKDGKVSKRTYFSKLDEQELFNRKLFLKRSVKDGLPVIREDHQYWGSIILRATGARPNELFQSELSNWQYDHSIKTWVLWTSNRGDDQHIKNYGSIRAVPMPAIVMEKGFDEFIRKKKPDIKKQQSYLTAFDLVEATSHLLIQLGLTMY